MTLDYVAKVLTRDAHTCQVRGPHCLINADTIDHIIGAKSRHDYYHPSNWQAVCTNCRRTYGGAA